MCLLAIFYRALPDAPLVLGANREEFYSRGGEPPRILEGERRALAGVDPVAGGTWLGINDKGLFVAVTNRQRTHGPVQPRSRGLLTRDLLLTRAVAMEAEQRAAAELQSGQYQGCNLVCADSDHAVVLEYGDELRIRPLSPGLHVLANGNVDDEGDPRVGFALRWLGQNVYGRKADCATALKTLCGKVGGDGEPSICFHSAERGTVSSTIIAVPFLGDSVYLHAQGPPDRTPYVDYSDHLRRLAPVE
jgi:uncharacterized protein with NRDE domain